MMVALEFPIAGHAMMAEQVTEFFCRGMHASEVGTC